MSPRWTEYSLSSIDELVAAIMAARNDIGEISSSLAGSVEVADEIAEQFHQIGSTDKVSQVEAIQRELAEGRAQLDALDERADQAVALAEALRGTANSGPSGASTVAGPAAGSALNPVGEWDVPPKRTFGNRFNECYEQWVKTSNGGPDSELEYRVKTGDNREVWFDARRIDIRDGHQVEVLLDAKGRYGQFVEPDGSDFRWFFRERGGLTDLLGQARRQVNVAGGRYVEWWCADEEFSDVFNDYLDRQSDLAGRIEAVHKPMPVEGGQR